MRAGFPRPTPVCYHCLFDGGVAQWLEQAAHIRCVGGSNPSTAIYPVLTNNVMKPYLDPHFSHPLYCIGAMIHPDCVALGQPPQRTVQYVCGDFPSRALSVRPFRRFVTRRCEK